MDRDTIVENLRGRLPELRARGIKTLVLFGPVARGEAGPGSEVDFLLELHPPLTFEHYREVREHLRQLLGRPVEIVLESPHHPLVWPLIEDEAVFLL